MNNIIKFKFENDQISFDRNGWINATEAAAKFGKKPSKWLELTSAKSYMHVLAANLAKQSDVRFSDIKLVKTSKVRGSAGTWLHPKLAVIFARWLSDEFAVQCDLYIDSILFGYLTAYDEYQNACNRLEAAQKEVSKCGKGLAHFRWQKPELVHSVGYWHEQLQLPFAKSV